MDKPYIVKKLGCWWCYNENPGDKWESRKAWNGTTPSEAYQRWHNFNRMKQ